MTKPTVEQKGCSIVGCGYVYGECNLLRGYKAPPGPHLTGGELLVDILGGGVTERERGVSGGRYCKNGNSSVLASKACLPSGDRFMERKDQALTVLLL